MGLVIVNPWVRSEETLARVHVKHYYARRLLQAEFWRKLGSGSFDLRGSLASLLENVRASFGMRDEDTGAVKPFQQRMAQDCAGSKARCFWSPAATISRHRNSWKSPPQTSTGADC
jgi:hypothetical protein